MNTDTTSQLDPAALPPYQKRRFVPENARLTDLNSVRSLYKSLVERAVSSAKDFEGWILDRSELEAALGQESSILYIRMTCQTDDTARAKAYSDFIETIMPEVKAFDDQLNRKFLEEAKRFPLDKQRYAMYTKEIETDVALFVPENIPLETKEELLSQEYQTVCGAMTVTFRGGEHTLPQMHKYLLDQDRTLREEAWRATASRRLREKDKLDDLFDRMAKLRNTIAANAGYKNFCDYRFRELHRFDYTPQDCKEYHASMEQLVVPVWQSILKRRQTAMNVKALRPWDLSVDPQGRPALKPFEEVDELTRGCRKIFKNLDPELAGQFNQMADAGLLDLASRKGKAPGGYQSALDESRQPFIFMNAVGVDDDIRTLLHECGHAFHVFACAHDPLLDYRHGPMEFNEVASMAMELLASGYLNEFYKDEDAVRSHRKHLEDIVFTLVWVAAIDAFQHWIYEHPGHSPTERREAWVKIYMRFGGQFLDWTGLQEEQGFLWHRQLHVFELPFYYIEYGIAQLGALQLWRQAQQDLPKALIHYKKGLALGGSRPLPELYAAAGIRFDFSQATIRPLMDALSRELELQTHA